MTLHPHFQTITRQEIENKLLAAASPERNGASGKQVSYLAALIVRDDASRAVYQDFAVNTSGRLGMKKASTMIDRLLSI